MKISESKIPYSGGLEQVSSTLSSGRKPSASGDGGARAG